MYRATILAGLVFVFVCSKASAQTSSNPTPRPPMASITAPASRLSNTPATHPSGKPGRSDPCRCIWPWPVVHYYYVPPVYYYYQPIYQPIYVPLLVDPNGRPAPERVPPKPKPAEEDKPAAPVAKPKDDLEKRAETQRLIRHGNEAFADGHYLQAAKRYEQAAAAGPFEPMPYFHVAQAQLAQGKYAEAVLAIQRGMRIRPNWAEAPFQPRALYGDRVGEHQQHLAHLAEVVAKNMNDDSLLFLLGYQLWFDDRRDEAMVLFQRAALLAFDTTFVDRFIKAQKAQMTNDE